MLRLASLLPEARTEPDADYSYALAISRVLENQRTEAEALASAWRALQLAATKGTGDSPLDQSLFALRNRHLKRFAAGDVLDGAAKHFRAYSVTGGGNIRFVIEHTDRNVESVEVFLVREDNGTLRIEYKNCDPALSSIAAVDAIELALLKVFFREQHRDRISRVEYVDADAGFTVVTDYPV